MTVADLSKTDRRSGAHTADLTIVGGAGHVGIPLVLSFAAKGLTVNVNDLNLDNLAALKRGRLPFHRIRRRRTADRRRCATSD